VMPSMAEWIMVKVISTHRPRRIASSPPPLRSASRRSRRESFDGRGHRAGGARRRGAVGVRLRYLHERRKMRFDPSLGSTASIRSIRSSSSHRFADRRSIELPGRAVTPCTSSERTPSERWTSGEGKGSERANEGATSRRQSNGVGGVTSAVHSLDHTPLPAPVVTRVARPLDGASVVETCKAPARSRTTASPDVGARREHAGAEVIGSRLHAVVRLGTSCREARCRTWPVPMPCTYRHLQYRRVCLVYLPWAGRYGSTNTSLACIVSRYSRTAWILPSRTSKRKWYRLL